MKSFGILNMYVRGKIIMLTKIAVTLLVWMMSVVDVFGNITGANVCAVIDQLNELAYTIEDFSAVRTRQTIYIQDEYEVIYPTEL